MKKEYIEICKLTYKNQKYACFLDDDNKYFFLKIVGNKYSYITIKELVSLYKELFTNIPIQCIKKDKLKKISFIPKVYIGGILLAVTLTLTGCFSKKSTSFQNPTIKETISTTYTTDDKEKDIEKYIQSHYLEEPIQTTKINDSYLGITVYDMDEIDKILPNKVSISEIANTINNNKKISNNYKKYLLRYVEDTLKKDSTIDLRVFKKNLETLDIIECTKNELMFESLSTDSYACYRKDKNTIYVLKDYDYESDPWAFQVLYHEFSHAARNTRWKENKKNIYVKFSNQPSYGDVIEEALNSVYAISLYNENEKDIAYQLQSNYMKIMIDTMDNYSIEDYMKHDFSYFQQKLNEYNQNDLSKKVLALIELQYKDFHNDNYQIDAQDYNLIYEYITEMYLKNKIDKIKDVNQLHQVINELKGKILFDVPEEYHINSSYINEVALKYYEDYSINHINSYQR